MAVDHVCCQNVALLAVNGPPKLRVFLKIDRVLFLRGRAFAQMEKMTGAFARETEPFIFG
jgi:hypothetical protein